MSKRLVGTLIPIVLEIVALVIAGTSGAQDAAMSGDGGASFAALGSVALALVFGCAAGIFAIVDSIYNGGGLVSAIVCVLLSLFALFAFSFTPSNVAMALIAVVFFAIPMRKAFI